MKRAAPPIPHQKRLADATDTFNLTPFYQKTVQAGRKFYACPTR